METKVDTMGTQLGSLEGKLDEIKSDQVGLSRVLDAVFSLLHASMELKTDKSETVALNQKIGAVQETIEGLQARVDHLGKEQKGFFERIMENLQMLLRSKPGSNPDQSL